MVVQEELQYVVEGGYNLSTFYTVRNYQRIKRNCGKKPLLHRYFTGTESKAHTGPGS